MTESIVEKKKQNDDYSFSRESCHVADVELDYQIEGNEFQAEQLDHAILKTLQKFDDGFGDDDE